MTDVTYRSEETCEAAGREVAQGWASERERHLAPRCYAVCNGIVVVSAPRRGKIFLLQPGCAMNREVARNCRRAACANFVPAALAGELLCLDHFLDDGFHRASYALDRCREGNPLDAADVEWLLTDALAIVQSLEEQANDPQPEQRDRMLELLLMLANLHEYVAHHSVRLNRSA